MQISDEQIEHRLYHSVVSYLMNLKAEIVILKIGCLIIHKITHAIYNSLNMMALRFRMSITPAQNLHYHRKYKPDYWVNTGR
jgi:hypothetical protein